jgi:hypothetical protein
MKCEERLTHDVSLWVMNEYSEYTYWREKARECFDATDFEDSTKERKSQAVLDLAEMMEEYFSEGAEDSDCGAGLSGFWLDIMTTALAFVDWREVAECFEEDMSDV